MKKLLPLIILVCLCLQAFSQEDNTRPRTVTHYIFKEFLPGVVKKKTGQEVHILLNYNTLTEEMIFIKDTQHFAMIDLEQIDSVTLGGRTFVPGNDMFYEKLTNTPSALYVRNKTNVLQEGKDIGYGAKSESGSISTVVALIGPRAVYRLDLPQGFKLVDHTTYWVKKEDRFIQLTGIKKAQSAFPLKADAIKSFVQQNNIQFDKEEDMAKLVEFCNQPG